MEDNRLAYYGGAVKALGGGKIAGYGVLFTREPDLQGERFTKETDLELEVGERRTVYYRHGSHPIIKDRKLGKATLTEIDESGAFFEGELNLRDNYERRIYELAERGKLGWSTGSMPHMVRKEKKSVDGPIDILKWPVGEISLTPNPVEARTAAYPIKSLELDEPDELAEEVKSEVAAAEEPFSTAGLPALERYCKDVSPDSKASASQISESAAHAHREIFTAIGILGEANHSNVARLVRRSEHRFLKDNREIDPSTVTQVETLLTEMEKVVPAFETVKEPLLGLRKIAELSKAERKAMTEKVKFSLWNYYRISGYKPEGLDDGDSTS